MIPCPEKGEKEMIARPAVRSTFSLESVDKNQRPLESDTKQ